MGPNSARTNDSVCDVPRQPAFSYAPLMKSGAPLPVRDALEPDGPRDEGYAEWKRARVEKALAQAGDRERMIPAAQVWRDLGLER